MTVHVRLLESSDDSAYEALVLARPTSLLYAAPAWRDFLLRLRPEFVPVYLGAFDDERLVGALPGMTVDGPLGSVYNSLPFYGSYGGLILGEGGDALGVADALFNAFETLAVDRQFAASTVISSPLEPFADLYAERLHPTAMDRRIGQVTDLPADAPDLEGSLMAAIHQKTRNTVRKGMASGLTFEQDNSLEAFQALHAIHVENMAAIGGLAKPWAVFEALRAVLQPDRDYCVYVARDGKAIVSALLVLYYNRTAEYFTPATSASHRSAQPLSAMILRAMVDAARRGMRYWNWGGTWATQDGVYLFKSRWATRDLPYRYYVRDYPAVADVRAATRADLLQGYPMCYVIPFGELRS